MKGVRDDSFFGEGNPLRRRNSRDLVFGYGRGGTNCDRKNRQSGE
jgi:hypothetical protein